MIRRTGHALALLSTGLLLHACDCGGTPPGTGDASGDGGGHEAATTNRAPSVTTVEAIALLPGESAPLLVEAMADADGDALTCTWQASPALDGVNLPAGCADPLLAIDRATYEGGPEDALLTLALEVSDGEATVTRSIAVRVLDERGGDVANTSTWEGQGYAESGARHGFCGVPGRPCQDLDDAMVNLRARIAGGGAVEPLLRLATTGTAYARDRVLLLDDDGAATGVALSLECGFDPQTWDKVSDTWLHTPIRFASDEGVRITASGVRLEGCDLAAVEPLQAMASRTAVHVVDAAVEIVDNRLHGAPPSLVAAPELAMGLYIEVADADSDLASVVEGCTIQGGTATDMVFGLRIAGGVPRVVGNSILGGQAPVVIGAEIRAREGGAVRAEIGDNPLIEGGSASATAYGLHLAGGDVWLHDNPEILGCAIDCDQGVYVGVLVSAFGAGFSTPLLERNSARGVVGQHNALQAIGLATVGPVISRGGSYVGGRAALATGALLRAPLHSLGDRFEGGTGLDLDPVSPDDGVATGIELAASGVVLEDGMVIGGSASGPASLTTLGIAYRGEAALEATRTSVDTGPALEQTTGVRILGASSRLTLDASSVVAGSTAGEAGSRSTGVHHQEGTLFADAAVLRSGLAETTQALHVIEAGTVALSGGQILAGPCSLATGTSRGIWLAGSTVFTRLVGLELRGGDGCQRSYGLHVDAEAGRLHLRDSEVVGGQASQLAAGAYFEENTRGCRIERNLIQAGGRVSPATSLAVGLRLSGDGSIALFEVGTFVVANRIHGGSASVSQGLDLAGDAEDDVVLLHNLIAGGGLASGMSVAVTLSGDSAVAGAHAGLFVGNLIDAGAGATSLGYLEICSTTGGLHKAEPYYSFNNAFWPAIDGAGAEPTAYVHRTPNMDCSAAVDLTAVAQVNLLAYYGSGSANRASVDADPLFEADGYHLQVGSPLKDKSFMSDNHWPFASTSSPEDMLDVDGVARPCGTEYDIGVHELCP